jgi:hypothetical protein
MHAQPAFGQQRLRQQLQGLVHRAHQQVEHPQRDHQRHPDQQAGDDVALDGGFLEHDFGRDLRERVAMSGE